MADDLRESDKAAYEKAFRRLARSKFRARFTLGPHERAYIARVGLETIRRHAEAFVGQRLAVAQPENDGRQTPMRGHPVFIAQHATATCCRSYLEKWWHVPKGKPIPLSRQMGIVDFLMAWISKQLATSDPGEAVESGKTDQSKAI